MYLANIHPQGRPHYVIRETYRAGDHLLSRDLCDLGFHPGRFIRYPGGNAFYVDEQIEDRVRQNGGRPGVYDLENLLWDFVTPDIRHAVGHFHARHGRTAKRSSAEIPPRPIHGFDRRRLYYLRCGQMDQSRLARVPPRLFRTLEGKSRDEIEQLFIAMEKHLRPFECKAYLFTVFDLQRHFSAHFARTVPQWLDGQKIDQFFEREICDLQRDPAFWDGMETGTGLHAYLVRYLIMFFDGAFGRPTLLEEMLNDYINHHRQFHWPGPARSVSLKEAGEVFEVPAESLGQMSRIEITRHYRRLALRFHPDKGGDQARFVRLTEVYQGLLRRRPLKSN